MKNLIEIEANKIIERKKENDISFYWNETAIKIAKALIYSYNKNKSIIIYGSKGIGKSLISEAFKTTITNNASPDSRMVMYELSKNIITVEQYLNKALLIIDEFGREEINLNDYGTKKTPLIDLIYKRHEAGYSTVLISNFNMTVFNEKFKEHKNIIERLETFYKVNLKGADNLRKKY